MAREFSGSTQYLSHTGSNSSTQILGDVAAIADPPQRTLAQLKTAMRAELGS